MAERFLTEHLVAIFATDLLAPDKALDFQFLNDPLDPTLGDADLRRHLAKYQIGVRVQGNQHMRMVGQKRPAIGCGVSRCPGPRAVSIWT